MTLLWHFSVKAKHETIMFMFRLSGRCSYNWVSVRTGDSRDMTLLWHFSVKAKAEVLRHISHVSIIWQIFLRLSESVQIDRRFTRHDPSSYHIISVWKRSLDLVIQFQPPGCSCSIECKQQACCFCLLLSSFFVSVCTKKASFHVARRGAILLLLKRHYKIRYTAP